MRVRKYITLLPTTSFTLAGDSTVSEPILEKRSATFISRVRSLFISSTTEGSMCCVLRYSIQPSSDEMGVPS